MRKDPTSIRYLELIKNLNLQMDLVFDALSDGKFLGFGYVFGLSSVLLELLKPHCHPITLFIYGRTAIGKTAISKLIANLFFNSDKTEGTLNTTLKALELYLYYLSPTTVLLGDTILKPHNISLNKIVFTISNPIVKLKKSQATKYTNAIITSEFSEDYKLNELALTKSLSFTIHDVNKDVYTGVQTANEFYKKYIDAYGLAWDIIRHLEKNFDEISKWKLLAIKEVEKQKLNKLHNIAIPLLTSLYAWENFYEDCFEETRKFIYNIIHQRIKDIQKLKTKKRQRRNNEYRATIDR